MRFFLKTTIIASIAISSIAGAALLFHNIHTSNIKDKAAELKAYCDRNGYNTEYAILVDYSRNSLRKRLYVYDFKKQRIIMSSLAGHGSGGESTIFHPEFSNVPGSNCSSLGHYKIGKERRMYTRPCNAFELDGLDFTNSNVRKRSVLLHPSAGPLSHGCVTLPFHRYQKLSNLLNSQPRNIIMWVYN